MKIDERRSDWKLLETKCWLSLSSLATKPRGVAAAGFSLAPDLAPCDRAGTPLLSILHLHCPKPTSSLASLFPLLSISIYHGRSGALPYNSRLLHMQARAGRRLVTVQTVTSVSFVCAQLLALRSGYTTTLCLSPVACDDAHIGERATASCSDVVFSSKSVYFLSYTSM